MKLKTMSAMALGVLAAGFAAAGDLAVSAYWQDHMVLQRGKNITVWGKDAPGRTVTVSFTNQTATATTGTNGYWETTFAQPFALSATPQALTITDSASESITLSDVLVGDVYLAAGQSNMDRRLKDKDKAFDEPQSVKDFCRDDDGIRFLRIARSAEDATVEKLFDLPPIKPVNDTIKYYGEGFDWAPATMGGAASNKYHVSSVALNFAHYIRRANEEKGQNIPIGIIHASSGGTFIREWIAPSVLNDNGIYSPGSASSSDGWFWNNMMAPILRAKICAVLWYQGCSDSRPDCVTVYKTMMDILVRDRRERWGENGDLPFYAVQIGAPNYNSASGTIGLDQYPAPTEVIAGENYATIRECQRLWNMTDTGRHGLVTIVDCVDCLSNGALHPADKNFVGRRLSLLARRDIYGETDLPAEGPTYTRAVRESDGSVRIFFKSGTAKGLTAGRMKPASSVSLSQWVKKGTDPIRGFALCGSDNVWKDADATVEGETIVLRANGVPAPTKFHYGYWCVTRETLLEDGQRLNLYNEAGLPMSPVAPQTVEDPATSEQVTDPVLAPASCFFSPSTNVTIVCATSGATIRYTLDGSDPTESSTPYTAPIALAATTTVKARAFADGKEASDIVFATYTLGAAPVPDPNPLWTNGAYEPSEWRPLGENLLANATASYDGTLSGYAGKDMSKLVDGNVAVEFASGEVVGLGEDVAAIWTFIAPKTIGTIRISSRWSDTSFDAIMVKDVYVLQGADWVALRTPNSHRTGLASITTGALVATLSDDGLGYLAQNVSGLKIVFGKPETGSVANYYAEIEAIAPGGEVQPAEMAATPVFSPAACSFYPTTNVTLSCATAGATIRYTLDGSSPTATSAAYTAPIALTATTTVKARAFADGMNASAVASATYTYTEPSLPPDDPTVVTNGMWITSEFAPSAWSPLANNLLLNKTGTLTGTKSYMTSDIGKITDGAVPASNAQVADTFGFANDATVDWTFDSPKTLEKIRFTSCYIAGSGIYDDIKIAKIEVKASGSDSWTDLGVAPVNYAGSNTAGNALSATIENTEAGFLAQNMTALRITFGQQNNVAQYYAEIEAVGTESGGAPVATVATPTFSPAACSFYPTTKVTLACATSGATIRYTLDGSDPTAESAAYSAPIALSATTTVKARAFADEMNPSAVASATYTRTDSSTPSPEWATNVVAPSAWSPLTDNLLDGRTGAISGATAGDTYASRNPGLLTDGSVPMAGGAAYIVGFQNGASISWTFENPVTLGQVRISCGYLAQTGYSGFTVSAVEVQKSGSSVWTAVSAAAGQMKDTGKADILTLTLADGNGLALAENVTALRVSFATPPVGFANYCAEIEAAGTEAGGEGKVYPEWIDATSETLAAKYDAWAEEFNVGDPTAAQKDAYLLNCANTADAIAAAKAAFTVVSIAVNADGTVDVGMPTAPDGGFNGTVTILGCETVNGTYHAVTTGSLVEALYRVPAASNDRFFKASLEL